MADFDWNEYFSLAKELLEKEGEVYARASIGKAYYALYNILCLKTCMNKSKEGFTSNHADLISIFQKAELPSPNKLPEFTNEELKEIGKDLSFLRMQRNNADYDRVKKITNKDAKIVYQKVELILEKIKEE